MFYNDTRLALATNIVFPIVIAATIAFRYYSVKAYRLTRERMALVTASLQETLSGIRVVQAFAAEPRIHREFEVITDDYRRVNMRTIHLSAAYFPGVEWLALMGTAIVLYYGGILKFEGALTIGVMFLFIQYLNNFFPPNPATVAVLQQLPFSNGSARQDHRRDGNRSLHCRQGQRNCDL